MSLAKQHDWPANLDYKKQSVEVPGTKRPGQTGHYQNSAWGLISLETPNSFQTLPELFETGYKASKDKPFLGHRPRISTTPLKYADHYKWQTYGEIDLRRRAIGSALHSMFATGILGGGEFETIIDLALHAYRKVGVSLYDTLGKESVEYIINHAHLTVIFASASQIPALLKLSSRVPILKLIVSIDDLAPEIKTVLSAWGETRSVTIKDLRQLEEEGRSNPIEPLPAKSEDVATLCYTSGTTSTPKGVVLTHGMLAGGTQSNLYGTHFPDGGVLLSYLPLAHIYERIAELLTIAIGGSIGYFTGDPLRLLEDAQILKPNFFPSVPRVLNRVYQSAMAAGRAPGVKGALFQKAVQAKLQKLHATGDNTHFLWDRLVFRKIQAVLGGNLQLVTCGSAPISPDVMDFLKIAFSCDVVEVVFSYGMTENVATCTKVWPKDPSSSGTVGPPQPCNELKLVDVPQMRYTSEDRPYPRGELCVRGLNCFKMYYKDEKNTKSTVDDEGWIHTGDVAAVDECGRFKIIDRVKNIMKLAQGEYVALEKIENMYSACPVTAQIYVHGDSLQSYLIGVVVPDPIQLASIASKVAGRRVTPQDTTALMTAARDQRVRDAILRELTKEAKKNGLQGFELVKRIHISLEPFSVDNGTLTPTMKIRRKDAENLYKAELDALYALGEPASSHPGPKL
ncbi:hypothetical protein JAAARDRAFT_125417 [Jaapia argillacea MUCL 33604]|uniref:AMP-dependent synthetase/ligase domain-containing protein n=1 Tax=Jaapia argillacea MUCL 33604 TaxID=933084 RepID=A0A067QDH1_9AGAM|nr:hypothetical protein JAAARDRAFT_125417 [Jaapia argillacea MUCL 33604]